MKFSLKSVTLLGFIAVAAAMLLWQSRDAVAGTGHAPWAQIGTQNTTLDVNPPWPDPPTKMPNTISVARRTWANTTLYTPPNFNSPGNNPNDVLLTMGGVFYDFPNTAGWTPWVSTRISTWECNSLGEEPDSPNCLFMGAWGRWAATGTYQYAPNPGTYYRGQWGYANYSAGMSLEPGPLAPGQAGGSYFIVKIDFMGYETQEQYDGVNYFMASQPTASYTILYGPCQCPPDVTPTRASSGW